MYSDGLLELNHIEEAQIIHCPSLNGGEQMAADAMMLENLKKSSFISIRFYKWEGVWLSIGKSQKVIPKEWLILLRKRKINIVRRPSGGSAVLHSGGLTYSLAWSSPPKKKHQAYSHVNQWLINCFSELGQPLKFGNQIQYDQSENCFSSSTFADLVDEKEIKRIGSAQFWKQGKLLQHGEIILDPPLDLWKEVFNTDAPLSASKSIPRIGLEEKLIESFLAYWSPKKWNEKSFNANELEKINENSKNYFDSSFN